MVITVAVLLFSGIYWKSSFTGRMKKIPGSIVVREYKTNYFDYGFSNILS